MAPIILRIQLGKLTTAYKASIEAWQRAGFQQVVYSDESNANKWLQHRRIKQLKIGPLLEEAASDDASNNSTTWWKNCSAPHLKDLLSFVAARKTGHTYMDFDVMPVVGVLSRWPKSPYMFATEALRKGKRWEVGRGCGLALNVFRVQKGCLKTRRLITSTYKYLKTQQGPILRSSRHWMDNTARASKWVVKEKLKKYLCKPIAFRSIPLWQAGANTWDMTHSHRAYDHYLPTKVQLLRHALGIDIWHGHLDRKSSRFYNPALLKAALEITH